MRTRAEQQERLEGCQFFMADLTLSDVRDYLIDTDAVKDAEKLLLSQNETGNKEKDISQHQRYNKTDDTQSIIRNRLNAGRKQDKKEELLGALANNSISQKGKLGLLREEEEMKELQMLESQLREENMTLERERQKIAAETQSMKRSQLKNMGKETEQDLLNLENQRSSTLKELDKKKSLIETLQADLRAAELDMDEVAINQLKKKEEDGKGKKGQNSTEDRMHQMFDLVTEHTVNIASTNNQRDQAKEEMLRIEQGHYNYNEVGSNMKSKEYIPYKGEVSTTGYENVDEMLSEVNMRKQSERLENLKKDTAVEITELDLDSLSKTLEEMQVRLPQGNSVKNSDESLNIGASSMNSNNSKSIPSGLNKSLKDTLDEWLNDSNDTRETINQSEDQNNFKEHIESKRPKNIIESHKEQSASQKLNAENLEKKMESNSNNSSKSSSLKSENDDITQSNNMSQKNGMEQPADQLDTLKEEIIRLQDDSKQRDMQMKKQQEEFQRALVQQQQQQQQQQNIYGAPGSIAPGNQYANAPQYQQQFGMGLAAPPMNSMAQQPNDPMQMLFMQQMQKMVEQMESDNSKILSQIGEAPSRIDNRQDQKYNRNHDRGLSIDPYNDGFEYGIPKNGQHHPNLPLHRKQLAKVEAKYDDDIRILDLEMERAKKEVDLENFKYDAEKVRSLRKAEDEHESWLDAQKKELQALKMKQAMAKEQRMLDIQLKAMQPSNSQKSLDLPPGEFNNYGENPTGADKNHVMLEEAGVGAMPLPVDLAKGASIIADGIIVPPYHSAILESGSSEGDQSGAISKFRLVLGVYNAEGDIVANMAASKWQNWGEPSTQVSLDLDPILKEADGSIKTSPDEENKKNNSLIQLLNVPVKRMFKQADTPLKFGLRGLVEIQVKSISTGETSALGWSLFDLVSGPPAESSANTGLSDMNLCNGMWRLHIRLGLSNPAADPSILPENKDEYITDGFVLLRIGDSADSGKQYAWTPRIANIDTESSILLNYNNPLAKFNGDIESKQNEVVNSLLRESSKAESRRSSKSERLSKNGSRQGSTKSDRSKLSKLGECDGIQKNNSKTVLESTDEENEHSDDDDDDENDDEPITIMPSAKQRSKDSVPWLKGTDPGLASERYQKGDGVDIYIDSGMYFPDNVTITRVFAQFFSIEKEPVGGSFEAYSSVTSSAISPSYNYKIELRGSSLNVTQTCLLRFDTLDSSNMKPATVGYACFKIFCTKDREQPKVTNEPNVYINTSLRQLPIRGNRVPKLLESYDENMLNSSPKIPCASVLVRICAAPRSPDGLSVLSKEDSPEEEWIKQGLMVSGPAYTSGAYSGALCEPDDMETFCFAGKLSSVSTTVDGALVQAISSITPGVGAPNYIDRPTGNEKVLTEWANSLIPNPKEMRSLLDYSLLAPYSLDSGICICIDQLFNMPDLSGSMFSTPPANVYKVIYSIVPPGLFYKDPPMSEEVYFTKTEDYSRPYKTPSFLDGFVHLFPPLLDDQSYLVLEVRSIRIEQNKTKPDEPILTTESQDAKTDKSWWTLLPVSKERLGGAGFRYTASGTYQLPLIKGAVPSTDLFSTDSADPLQEITKKLKSRPQGKGPDSSSKMSDGCSVVVRVCNPLFRGMLEFAARQPGANPPSKEINTSFMSTLMSCAAQGITGPSIANMNKFTYDSGKFSTSRNDKTTQQRLPSTLSNDMKKLTKSLNKHFSVSTGIALDS